MRRWNTVVAALAAALAVGACGEKVRAAEWKLACPAPISTTQSVGGTLPPEWTSFARSPAAMVPAPPGAAVAVNANAISVSLFDGPPQELADLVPDNPSSRRPRWTLAKERKRDSYVVCNYADTRMKLARKVPAEVRSCAVDAGTGATVSVTCR